jgi:carbonic anhydrase/acetyltransferase-like protein (isoleucine patch superfamily)
MPLIQYNGVMPKVAEDVFIAEGACVIGDVTIGPGSSVWYNTVIRGDIAPVVIGRNTNIQDNTTIHVDRGKPTVIGDNVSVGHGAVVHGCTVEDGALIAIHATVLSGAVIGTGSIVGAGAVVGEGKSIPPGSLALGVPARVVRKLTAKDSERAARTVRNYNSLAQQYRTGAGGDLPSP